MVDDSEFSSPRAYTPSELAERILTSKAALEGERKQITVLFADLEHLRAATRMYREMDMRPWLVRAEVGLREPE